MKKIIAFDCISGDREVFYALNAIYKFLKENKDYKVIAFIDDSIDKVSLIKGDNIEYRYVKEKILQTDSPLEIRRKPNSSLILAIKEVVEGNASAVITAAASPAVVLAGYLYSKPLKPDFKPAFCPIVTSIEGNKKILLDAGANKDVTSEMLKNYAILGRIYLKTLEVSDNPRVRLLNIGQEENKGNDFMIETYNLLWKHKEEINFLGNMEANEILFDKEDIILADAILGNIATKSYEGAFDIVYKAIKRSAKKHFSSKLALMLAPKLRKDLRKAMNVDDVGGAIILGLNHIILKSHGSSGEKFFFNTLQVAKKLIDNDLMEKIKKEFD